jgi:hypothetical protein
MDVNFGASHNAGRLRDPILGQMRNHRAINYQNIRSFGLLNSTSQPRY